MLRLEVEDGQGRRGGGTGFLISADGLVVTNAHVLEGQEKVQAFLSTGAELPVLGWLAKDNDRDLALLQVDAAGLRALELGNSLSLRAGQDVWYMLARNEGHGFRKKENRDLFLQLSVMFLEQQLLEN